MTGPDDVIRPTRAYIVMTIAVGLLIGAVAGLAIAALSTSVVTGVVVGIVGAALVIGASLLSVRRRGRGSVEGAPPWAGHPGDRGPNGSV